jgi:hypothetical protein
MLVHQRQTNQQKQKLFKQDLILSTTDFLKRKSTQRICIGSIIVN